MSATFLDAISADRVIDGRFPLLEKLGGTEWSSAHLTELDDGRGQRAAIKIFSFKYVDERATVARWDVARTLSHPHLMPLFHAGRCAIAGEDLLYVVTEYADETLSQILPDRPLSPRETREMLGPVLGALSYLHNRCLTHGHIRPTNIMVIDDKVKLSPDFGWRSRTRSIYDAPETGTLYVAPAADIWSLGILLVEALTQQPPVWDRSHGGDPEIPTSIPEPFFTICKECLRTDPARRCTLGGIKARLNSLQTEELAVQPVEQIVHHTAKPSYGFRAKVVAGAVVVLLLMVATFTFGWNLTPSSPAAASAPQPQATEVNAAQAPAATTVTAPSAAPVEATAPAATAAPTAESTPPAAAAPEPSAAPAAAQTPAATPAAEPSKDGVVKGSVARQALPDIPARISGTIRGHFKVQIRVEVDAEGNVSGASIDSQGPSSYFANQALHTAENWKFTPAKVDGRAVASTWLLQFQFGQSESVVAPTEETP